jgi:hypothetical protein
VPLFVFTLNGRRTRAKELQRPLMKSRGNFINRCNPARISSSKPGNFVSVYHRLIYVPIVIN